MRTPWERRSEWFAKTFKPLRQTYTHGDPPVCHHPAERLHTRQEGGMKEIRCLVCGEVTARQEES